MRHTHTHTLLRRLAQYLLSSQSHVWHQMSLGGTGLDDGWLMYVMMWCTCVSWDTHTHTHSWVWQSPVPPLERRMTHLWEEIRYWARRRRGWLMSDIIWCQTWLPPLESCQTWHNWCQTWLMSDIRVMSDVKWVLTHKKRDMSFEWNESCFECDWSCLMCALVCCMSCVLYVCVCDVLCMCALVFCMSCVVYVMCCVCHVLCMSCVVYVMCCVCHVLCMCVLMHRTQGHTSGCMSCVLYVCVHAPPPLCMWCTTCVFSWGTHEVVVRLVVCLQTPLLD